MLLAKYFPPPRDHIHLIRELYQEELLLEEFIRIGKEWKEELQIRKFFCDPSQPEFIARMRKARLWAVAAEKELELAINTIKQRLLRYHLRQTGALSATPDCPMVLSEFPKLHTPEKKKGKPMKDKPVEVDNYALRALEFLVVGLSLERTVRVRWL